MCASPWPCGDSCGGPHFRGSRLLTPDWGGTLNGWAGKGEWQEWALCCSTFEGCDTGAKFHAGCDAHTPTLTVAHNAGNGGSNPGNFTFGGFVRSPSTRLWAAILVLRFGLIFVPISSAFCRFFTEALESRTGFG